MGPVILLDKSALQALSMDESVWLDAFFSSNIVPLFYVETLADLSKDLGEGRTAEDLVGMLALKTPSNAYPNMHHRRLVLAELAGYALPMDGQVMIDSGEARQQPGGKRGLHIGVSPEAHALARWQEGDFHEVERSGARAWRAALAEQDSSFVADGLAPLLTGRKVSNLAELKAFIDEFCASTDHHVLELMLQVLAAPPEYAVEVASRWKAAGRPALDQFAPYSVHVFKVELLFYLGVHRGFISGDRASNRVDMAYLYYLPFTKIFVSGDRLHQRSVPLFLQADQRFLWSEDLKTALAHLDGHYRGLPDEIKARGTLAFASMPPSDIDNLVAHLWDQHMHPEWRRMARDSEAKLAVPFDGDPETVAELKRELDSAEPVSDNSVDSSPDYVLIKRQVRAEKGSWRIVPKDLVEGDEADEL